MIEPVLDASAVIAMLRDEPGGDQVSGLAGKASICAVNLAEVIARIAQEDPQGAMSRVLMLPFRIVNFDAGLAIDAGLLRSTTDKEGLSLGDRACLALARRNGAPAWTTDQPWAKVDVGVEIVLLR